MKKAATSGQFRELIGKLLTKIGDEKIALIENQQIQNAIDQPDQTALNFIAWINNGCKIVGQTTVAQVLKNLAFVCEIMIGNVTEFVVGEKFQLRAKNKVGIQLRISDNFKNWVLEPMKNEKVSLIKNSKLKKFSLLKPMNDTEIKSELQNPNPIEVEIFLPLLWDMLSLQKEGEARELGLLNNGYANIFHVELKDKSVVAVRVYWCGDEWRLGARELDCVDRWRDGRSFFTLATA